MTDRKRMLNDLDGEIRDHIEREMQDNIERGMSAEDARHAALKKFGNVTLVKEDTRAVWTFAWLEELLQDLRYGLRTLRNSPGFTLVAVLTLAFGIGANTAIFSLIDAVMLRSLPVANPSQLVLLKWSARTPPSFHGYMSAGDCPVALSMSPGVGNPAGCSLSEPMFREIAKSGQFSGVAAFANSGPVSLTGNGPATMISGQLVSGDFFQTLGLKPALGRLFVPSDDSPSAARVAVLNYGYWQRAFGASPDVVGRTINLNGVAFTIVGVAEQRFTGVTPGSDYDVWLPLAAGQPITLPRMWSDRQNNTAFWWLTVVGRLKPEVPQAQAQAAISSLFRNQALYGPVRFFGGGGPGAGPGPGRGPGGAGPGGQTFAIVGAPANGRDGGPTGHTGPPPPGGTIVQAPPPASSARNVPYSTGSNAPTNAAPTAQPSSSSAQPTTNPDDVPVITFVNAQTAPTGSRRQFASPLYVLMFAVGIILLIACSNVAGLMLARGTARQKEMALRLALGAGRARIVRQLLTESLILSLTGGLLGVLFAWWGAHAILSFVSSNQPRPLTFAADIDVRMLGFTLGISVFTGILFGLAPAFRSTRVDLTPALKEGIGFSTGMAHGGGRIFSVGNALVITQVALAIVVLVGAGLLVRTLQNLRSLDIGFDSHNLVIFGLNPPLAGYKPAQVDSFYRDLQSRLVQTPGVKSVSYSMFPLLSGALMSNGFHWPGTPLDRMSEADALSVGPGFFTTMQIPFLSGREFTASDYEIAAKSPESVPQPVIVDQSFVSKYVGSGSPIGVRFGEAAASADEPASPGYEIVGVVRDTKYSDLRRTIGPMMYMPQSGQGASFEIRTAGDPQALVPVIRNTVAQIDPNLPLRDVHTESQQIDRILFQERLVARLSTFFGVLALVLACIGLYGLLAYEVERRTREIGVRLALGAQSQDVLRLVVRQGLSLALVGSAVGVGVAFGVTRYLKSMLYDVNANDPVTLVGVTILLVLVALAACFIPARRATTVDPIIALRCE
jgi:predicted permease